jgi:hypothetical protein
MEVYRLILVGFFSEETFYFDFFTVILRKESLCKIQLFDYMVV